FEFRRACGRADARDHPRHNHQRSNREGFGRVGFSMPSAPLLDRAFLEKLERLTIHWQKSFAGLVGGHNRSRFPGAGQEFLDHRLTRRMFCSGGRHRFTGVMDSITGLTSGGATDYLAVTREFIGAYSQRGLLIIISDFLDDNGCERALQYLSDYGHELMLLQV